MATEPANRTAVVTGGNRGIGLEICRQLADMGIRVILAARDDVAGSKEASKLKSPGLNVTAYRLDVSDPESIAAFKERVQKQEIQIDILVNNAGVSLNGFNAQVVQQTMAVNFFGPLNLTDALLLVMAPTGRIVMVSSGLGELSYLSPDLQREFTDPALTRDELVGLVNRFLADVEEGAFRKRGWPRSAYSVSKVALNALTRILSHDLRDTRIVVNAVCPGWVRTGMGGRFAPRSVSKGADGIVWAATLPDDGPNGAFLRDRAPIPW